MYTQNALWVLSLALCMVIDVIFSIDGRRWHQDCWAGVLVSNLLAAPGVARLRVAFQIAHPPRWACPGPPNVPSKMVANGF